MHIGRPLGHEADEQREAAEREAHHAARAEGRVERLRPAVEGVARADVEAVRAPERLHRLVLANTAAYMGPPSNWQARIEGVLKDGMAPLAEGSITRWFPPAFPASDLAAVAPVRAMLLANDPVGYAGCCAAIRDMDQRPTAGLNRTPTLVIAGSEDPSTSIADARFLTESARDARLVTLKAAHLSNVEQAKPFATAVLHFLG